MPPKKATKEKTIALFWEKVSKTESCWLWTSGTYWDGYGKFWSGYRGRTVRAHRFSYEIHKGEIGEGLLVCHSCDTPKCVNPDHLWLGTVKDNHGDMTMKGRNFFSSTANPSLKLTGEEVRCIRESRKRGVPLKDLSRRYGVAESTVSRIANGVRRAL